MIVTYSTTYRAKDMMDALRIAALRWQHVMGDPKARLPWGASITITDDDDMEGGSRVELEVRTDYSVEATNDRA